MIREISTEAQQMAADANLDPRTVLTPINQLLGHVTTTEAAGQRATIQADASSLKNSIATALANNDTDTANRLIAEYQDVVDRANAHGNADLVKDVNTGLNTLIDKMPDARQRGINTLVARAIELKDTGGSEADISALLASDPEVRQAFNKEVAEREATDLEIANAQATLAKRQADLAEAEGRAQDRAVDGAQLTRDDLKFLTNEEYAQYKVQHANFGEYPAKKIDENKKWLARNKSNQDQGEKRLSNQAKAYVQRMPMIIAEMEESTDMSYDLDDWAEMTADPLGRQRWQDNAAIIAELVASDPRFIGGDAEEKERVARDITIQHMNGVSENFKKAWSANEKARNTREGAEAIRAEERAAEWVPGKSPEQNPEVVDAEHKLHSAEARTMGKAPLPRGEFIEKVWKPKWHYATNKRITDERDGINLSRGVRGNRVETDLATNLFGDRQSGSQAPRQPVRNSGQPSLPQRQRANLSPPIGPMGEPDDYVTKLRQAREGQPNSPYPDLPPASDPYIYPPYRKLGGG
jgi:hypothetical protein